MRRTSPYSIVAMLAAILLVVAACGEAEEPPAEDPAAAPEADEEPAPPEEEEEPEAPEEEEAEAVDFPTEDITLITRGSPGGGHDTFTRAMAPMLEEELGVTVIVENMTGGAGVVAAEHMRTIEPDGHVIHLMDPVGLLGNAIAEDEGFDFDSDFDFVFLGTVTQRPTSFAVAADSDIETWDQFIELIETGEARWSHTGLGSTHAYNTMIVFDELGLPDPVFVPHEGSAEVFTALARGDGDFTVLAIDSVADAVDEGDVRALLYFGGEPMDLLPDAQRGEDVGIGHFDGVLVSSLALVAPPGTPEPVAEVLREAVESVFFSDELAEWGEEADRLVVPLSAADTETQLRSVVELYQSYRDVIAPLVEQ